jgi:hypothetical protein
MKARKTFVAPVLVEELSLGALTLVPAAISGS